jgi:hypothetical protein
MLKTRHGLISMFAGLLYCMLLFGGAPLARGDDATPADEAAAHRAQLVAAIEKAVGACARVGDATLVSDPSSIDNRNLDEQPKTLKIDYDRYPMGEIMQGHQAILIVSFMVDSLGNPRFVHVDRQIAADMKYNGFVPRVLEMFRTAKYSPGTKGGKPVAAWRRVKIKFIVNSEGRMGNILSDEKLNKYVKQAREGDMTSQIVVSYADSVAHEEVGIPEGERRHFLAVAAVAGERSALLRVAQLLGYPSCKAPALAEEYIRRQAMSGKSDLELVQATRLLARNDTEAYHDIGLMLHGAANSNDEFVQLWAAGILATTPVDVLRDPAAALATAQALKAGKDPDAGELLAAALAANGQYADAVREETAAIAAANKLHWKDDLMQPRLAKYSAGQPWIGNLCDCNSVVPGGGL